MFRSADKYFSLGKEALMRYRIEYTGGRCSVLVDNRQELVRKIKTAAPGAIEDIRKLYKNGVSDSVMEKYRPYLQKRSRQSGNSGKSQ